MTEKKSTGTKYAAKKYEGTNQIIERLRFIYPDDTDLWTVSAGKDGVKMVSVPPGSTKAEAIARYKELYL